MQKRRFEESTSEDYDAFKGTFESNYRNLRFFALQLIGDTDRAEDIVQDAFVSYWNQKQHISKDEKAIKGYLYASVKFIAYNQIRHQRVAKRHKHLFASDSFEEEHITAKIMHAEVISAVHEAIEALPEQCKTVFQLSYFEYFTNDQIAKELQISINTVKTHKKRGLKVLRSLLRPDLFALFFFLYEN